MAAGAWTYANDEACQTTMNQKQQIIELNTFVKVRVAPSKKHGVGLFAMRDIFKGQKLYADMIPRGYDLRFSSFRELFPEVREYLLERWPQVINGSAFYFPDTRVQAFINHSTKPNYDAVNDVMLADCKVGKEILEDYRVIPRYDEVYKSFDKFK